MQWEQLRVVWWSRPSQRGWNHIAGLLRSGSNHLMTQVYNFTGTLTGTPTPPGGGNGNGGDPILVAPVTTGLPNPWKYAACYVYVCHPLTDRTGD